MDFLSEFLENDFYCHPYQCGSDIQTEQHVLIDCDLVTDIRRAHGCDVIEWREFMIYEDTIVLFFALTRFYI